MIRGRLVLLGQADEAIDELPVPRRGTDLPARRRTFDVCGEVNHPMHHLPPLVVRHEAKFDLNRCSVKPDSSDTDADPSGSRRLDARPDRFEAKKEKFIRSQLPRSRARPGCRARPRAVD
jgi:hypothetical protein